MAKTQSKFGKNLRRLRVSRDLTQAELAALATMLPMAVTRLEVAPVVNPQFDTIRRLASAFGMTTDEFVREMEAAE